MTVHPRGIPGLDDVLDTDVYAHCFEDIRTEVGGVLLGRLPNHGPPAVMASIRMRNTEAGSVSFSQEAWEQIHRVRRRTYPEYEIVGWYHSYPGFGVFLSEQDRFIHETLFAHRSQIVLVIDPVAQEEAVFRWSSGEIAEYLRRTCGDVEAIRPRSRWDPSQRRSRSETQHSSALVQRDPATGLIAFSDAVYLGVIAVCVVVVLWALLLRNPTPFSFS